ncbi:MAG: glutamine--fructose-6-phosphate transaminase (isomerizing) [Clostridia bacterium]|nr:glutamine--fructose-6-phosphate transaminase (isomerizing) [Clostridia bacterium]
MCGIIGYIGGGDAAETVLGGLKRLEYRGYDSAGAAFLSDGKIQIMKKQGRVEKLAPLLKGVQARVGIGHTRWATHGVPSDINAHPHRAGGIAIVHNGIIENYAELKAQLIAGGAKFLSDTDSEVVAHLLQKNYNGDLVCALYETVKLLKGSYALMAICEGEQKIAVARHKSPLIIGYGKDGNYCASDEPALAGLCENITILEDGDVAEITADGVKIFDKFFKPVSRLKEPNLAVSASLGLDGCPHYMLKELRETPLSVEATARAFAGVKDKLGAELDGIERIILTGCGTAYHAAICGKRYIECFARIPAECETAGEFRYKNPVINNKTAVIAVSQSGETADTVEAARLALSLGAKVIAVTNSHRSELTRLATVVVPVAAGPEICVAATKSYTGQIAALYLAAAVLAGENFYAGCARKINEIPALIAQTLEGLDMRSLAHVCASSSGVYFLGRDLDYAVALEGSLKLKEVSYVPGEGYPSGELKHGTLALVDVATTSVVIITDEELAGKSENAVEQVLSRGGKVAVITNIDEVKERFSGKLPLTCLPKCDKFLSPLLSAVAVQMLAYKAAAVLGREIDKPRNLAKSVTVE